MPCAMGNDVLPERKVTTHVGWRGSVESAVCFESTIVSFYQRLTKTSPLNQNICLSRGLFQGVRLAVRNGRGLPLLRFRVFVIVLYIA